MQIYTSLLVLPLTLLLLSIPYQPTQALATTRGGGGFGSPKTTKNSSSSNNKMKKKKPTKSRTLDWLEESSSSSKTTTTTTTTTVLDKWGLPVPTIDDIFPPLPPNTELKPITENRNYTLTEIQQCLKDYIDLQLHHTFDETGIEKQPPSQQQQQQQQQPPMKLTLLHESPPVLRIDHFLTDHECQQIQNNQELLSQCYSVQSQTFPGAISQRTSTSWFAPYTAVPTFLAKTQYRLHIPLEYMEEPQIVRYCSGQQFSWHYDQVSPNALSNGGQRLMTLLVYLNTLDKDKDGGATTFRDLEVTNNSTSSSSSSSGRLTMKPQQGSALIFFPAYANGIPDERTLHQGQEILAIDKEKWIIQMWIHEKEYQAALPPGGNRQSDATTSIEQIAHTLGYI